MAINQKQLGAFWGNNALYFVESESTKPQKVFHIPFSKRILENMDDGALSPGGIELISAMGNALRTQKINLSSVNLSLPIKDIIFRSFVIPWMQSHELKSVLSFEASKYLPFSLNQLVYSYYPITITEEGTKRIRIIFVAIKKDTLENYISFFSEASLTTNICEPSPTSLIRTLALKKLLPEDQTIALIEQEDVNRITIIDNEIPQFVRELYITKNASSENITKKYLEDLTKEIKISLDYFDRQNKQLTIKKIVLLTNSNSNETSSYLKENIDIPINSINIEKDFDKNNPLPKIAFLNAFGASFIDPDKFPTHFNLGKEQPKTSTAKATRNILQTKRKKIKLKPVFITASICILPIIFIVFISNFFISSSHKEIEKFKTKLGSSVDSDAKFLTQKKDILNEKLNNFRKARISSGITEFLTVSTNILPDGVWLSRLNIKYSDSNELTTSAETKKDNQNLSITLEGYVYSDDSKKQSKILNDFLQNIKDDEAFKKDFTTINIRDAQTASFDKKNVIKFKIIADSL